MAPGATTSVLTEANRSKVPEVSTSRPSVKSLTSSAMSASFKRSAVATYSTSPPGRYSITDTRIVKLGACLQRCGSADSPATTSSVSEVPVSGSKSIRDGNTDAVSRAAITGEASGKTAHGPEPCKLPTGPEIFENASVFHKRGTQRAPFWFTQSQNQAVSRCLPAPPSRQQRRQPAAEEQ